MNKYQLVRDYACDITCTPFSLLLKAYGLLFTNITHTRLCSYVLPLYFHSLSKFWTCMVIDNLFYCSTLAIAAIRTQKCCLEEHWINLFAPESAGVTIKCIWCPIVQFSNSLIESETKCDLLR